MNAKTPLFKTEKGMDCKYNLYVVIYFPISVSRRLISYWSIFRERISCELYW